MDYPKSVPGVGLVDGKFVDEDKSIPRAGSLIPSSWGNAVTEEILAVLRAAGIDPDEANNAQLLDAIRIVCDLRYPRAYSIAALPTENVGPITVIEVGEIWLWTATQYFAGYRSPLCGRPVDGHTVVPLASEVDAVGGTLSKAAYAGLWGYAQENALVVAAASWTSGMHKFVDLGGDNFRCPDLRNQFRRYTGTDADTANARAIGSTQLDASQRIQAAAVIRAGSAGSATGVLQLSNGAFATQFGSGGSGSINTITRDSLAAAPDTLDFDSARVTRASSETRPMNAAYAPRIHV